MKKSEIRFTVQLDEQNIPEKIFWEATDNPTGKMEETKAIAISVWDPYQQNTLRIDLWSKDMNVDYMKQFCIESLTGMADMVKNSTGDEKMSSEIKELSRRLVEHINREREKNQ